MKALLAVAGLLLLGMAGLAMYLFMGARRELAATAYATELAASPAVASATSDSAARDVDLLARVDDMALEIADLRAKLAELKAGASREPVAAPEKLEEISSATFAALHKDAIQKVIEADRAEQQRKREEEQKQREMENLLARAERTAQKLGLSADQQKMLADVYVLERQRMEDLRTNVRDQAAFMDNPEGMREAFRELRDWRLNELTARLGGDLAQKINESDGGMRGFGQQAGAGGQRRGNRGQTDAGPTPPAPQAPSGGGGF